jgi:hypothetical protein
MALGVSLGIVLGAALDIAPGAASASKATVSNKPLPRPLGL